MVTFKIDNPKPPEYTPLGLPNFSLKCALARFNLGFLSARIGEWLFTVAVNWVIFVETQSPLLLGVINACRLLPNLFFSVPAGELADRRDRRTLNLHNTLWNTLLTIAVGVSLCLKLPFWLSALLVTARAITTATEASYRNAYMCGIFEGDRLKQAVAQNASLMNLGRIIGPIMGGALLSRSGALVTFLWAGLFTVVHAVFLQTLPKDESQITGKPRPVDCSRPSFRQTLRDNPDLGRLLLISVPVMFFGFPFTGMLPLITESMLGLGSEAFGTLLAISAAGALVASSRLAFSPENSSWEATRNYALLFGLSLLALVGARGFLSGAVILFIVGYLGQAYRSCSRMRFQEVVPKEVAGKMMGVALMDRGVIPIGGLLVGAVAEHGTPEAGVVLMGLGCFASVAWLYGLPSWLKPAHPRRWGLWGGALALLTLSVVLAGCRQEATEAPVVKASASPSVRIDHAWGSTEVPLSPAKIVVLDLTFLDACVALGQPVAGFAGTSEKTVPEYLVKHLGSETRPPVFVGERKQPNLEVILSLEPDLIVANPDRHSMIRPQLEEIAPTIALTDDSLDQITDMVAKLALICHREPAYEEVTRQMQSALADIGKVQVGRPTVLVVGAFEDEFSTWTEQSFIGSLFTTIGAEYMYKGTPSASESQTEVAKITVEGLAQLDPDFLFVYGDPARWQGNPIYQKLRAVQEDRVFSVDRDLWSRARGPIAAQEILALYTEFLKSSQEVALIPGTP